MDDSLIPMADLLFLLRWLDPARSGEDLATAEAVLDVAAKLAGDVFLAHYKQADQHEPWCDDSGVHILPAIGEALRQYREAGFFAAGFPEQLGGLGLSSSLSSAILSQFAAANIATSAYPMLTAANARLIAAFGDAAQIDEFARPQIAGRWFGTMCLSEPQAGSGLADIRTRAVPDGRDNLGERYRLAGNKMWISGGDQDVSENIVHLVLAKIPNVEGTLPEGTAGISLFIVPKVLPDGASNDVAVAGLNHKMGYRGTANCLLNLGEAEGAIGWIVGEPGRGLAQMFYMMNEARIAVAVGAAALAYRGYRLSLRYAQERLQGRASSRAGGSAVPIIAHADVRRMLLTQKAYAEGALALCLFCARLVEQAQDDPDASALLALLTPVTKTWASEYGLMANDIAIQIHGGYGYTRDFDVEQLYRDNRLNPIHEGTTGIQALDLLGRKVLSSPTSLASLRSRVDRCIVQASDDPRLTPCAEALAGAWLRMEGGIEGLRSAESDTALAASTPFLWAFGHLVMAWIWLQLALEAVRAADAGEVSQSFASGKLRACRYFFECELPKIDAWLAAGPAAAGLWLDASVEDF